MRMRYRSLIIISHDMLAAAGAFLLALYLRLGLDLFNRPAADWLAAAAIFTMTAGIVFFCAKLHRGVWRYASIRDLSLLLKAATATVIAFVPLCFILTRMTAVPRSVPFIAWFILVIFLGGSRLSYRLLREGRLAEIIALKNKGARLPPVLLVGAGDEADIFLRALAGSLTPAFRVIGAIDDKPNRVGRQLRGVPILGEIREFPAILARLAESNQTPAKLILTQSPDRLGQKVLRELFEQAGASGIGLARLPSATLTKDTANPESLGPIAPRALALEDLLARPEIALDRAAIAALIHGKRVLITGAGGSIGSELCRQIARLAPAHLTLCDATEFNLYQIDLALRESHPDLPLSSWLADVRDREHILSLIEADKPQIIFHAAALKHVPLMEQTENIRAAILTNVFGTRNVADAAARVKAEAMIMISTDKAVHPTNVMGATKRLAEYYCQAQDLAHEATRFITVRFGNVLGSTGSVVPRFREQIAQGGPVTVTHPDITRYFMTIGEAVELVLQASAHGLGPATGGRGRIFVLDMGEPIKIADLARQMIRLADLRPDQDIRIDYTGLRPGEKLYEELFSPTEAPEPSGADGVLVARAETILPAIIEANLGELEAICRQRMVSAAHLAIELRTALLNLVPGFQGAPADKTPLGDEAALKPLQKRP